MLTVNTTNEQETMEIAQQIAEFLQPAMTILLIGNLGAGKTTFTKGLGAGLGVKRVIKSPSYTIIREYTDGRLPLYHVDLYRLTENEVPDLGLEEYFDGEGVTVIEWPSVAPDELPAEYLEISLEPSIEKPGERSITLKAEGKQYEEVLDKLLKVRKL